jgi:hypothetical protein
MGRTLRAITRTIRRRSGEAKAEVLALTAQTGELLERSVKEARRLGSAARCRARGRGAKAKLQAATKLEELADRCEKVARQIKQRVAGEPISDRIISLSDPDARPIRKGKLGKPNEFGYVTQPAEVTSADLPDPPAGHNPRSTITTARARHLLGFPGSEPQDHRGRLRRVAQEPARHLRGEGRFGFDHSSDRGRGTEAAGWVVGLELRARTCSPTSSGRRRAPPRSDGVATRPKAKAERAKQLTHRAKKSKQLDKTSKRLRKQIKALADPNYPGLSPARPWGDPTAVQASGASRVCRASTATGSCCTRRSRSLLRRDVEGNGNPYYAQLSDIPPGRGDEAGLMTAVDPERATTYTAACALVVAAGLSWNDAVGLLEQQRELRELQADDGSAPVDWLDSTVRLSPPRPWSDEDWHRDQRRAAAAGVDVDRAAWAASAERGHDYVGEVAEQRCQDKIDALEQRSAGQLEEAQRWEDDRRGSAINEELTSRARKRTQQAASSSRRPPWGV